MAAESTREVFVIVNHSGPSSDVGMLDWVFSENIKGIERLRLRYSETIVAGDTVTEHYAMVGTGMSPEDVTSKMYADYS